MTKEEEILVVAEDEFFKNGYLNTSMVTVAKRAGVTHAMVNYYYRSKEQLFLKILDTHTLSFIDKLKSVMAENVDFIQGIINAADIFYDTLNSDRALPFLLQDVSINAPELLNRYREPVELFYTKYMTHHSGRLQEQIALGNIVETNMGEILGNIFQLVITPYLMIPTLKNICHLNDERIDEYILNRKKEMEVIIKTRYSRVQSLESRV